MQLKKQIKELVRAGKLSHLIKEIKQGRDQTKNGKKKAPAKDKSLAIYMIQPWQRMTRQKLTQSFARGNEITFPPLANSDGTEALLQPAPAGNQEPNGSDNNIVNRPRIREIQVVPSTAHGMLKFPVNGGIVTIRSTILIPAECTTVITSSKEVPTEAEVRPKNFKIALHLNFPDQEVAIGGTLYTEERTELCSLLKKNLEIFAW
ncbi:hypothetical protein Tco_1265695 [Tanacetum coccineum]